MDSPQPDEGTLTEVLGFELLEAGEERALGRFAVTDRTRQRYGVVHGGAYSAAAEWLASAATDAAVSGDGKRAFGQSNHTSFLRPISEGSVHLEARARHRGRTSWIWDVDLSDDERRLCAVARVTVAVR